MTRSFFLLGVALLVSACAHGHETNVVHGADRPVPRWRTIATVDDRHRVREWREAWVAALVKARASGHGEEIAREGALLEPDAALVNPAPPPGNYRCRIIKIGGQTASNPDFHIYPERTCRIGNEGTLLSFSKPDGPQRPMGLLFPDTTVRLVFLGTLQLSDETLSLQYGRDQERDVAGVLERVGDRRWRLVMPRPHFESMLDVIELVPLS